MVKENTTQTLEKTKINNNLRALVGDDQIGTPGSISRMNFEDNYRSLPVDFEYETNPNEFIKKASTKRYDTLIMDLDWKYDDTRREGYGVLEATRNYANTRILHSGESKEAIEKGYAHGATHCVPKGMPPEDLIKILKGGNE